MKEDGSSTFTGHQRSDLNWPNYTSSI